MGKWMVSGDMAYYPWIEVYETYAEAKKAYDSNLGHDEHTIYLSEISEEKNSEED